MSKIIIDDEDTSFDYLLIPAFADIVLPTE